MLEKVIKKENELLRAQSKETQQKNEKLRERINELEAEQTYICKWATKWYNQKKSLNEKYKSLKHELHGQSCEWALLSISIGIGAFDSGWSSCSWAFDALLVLLV